MKPHLIAVSSWGEPQHIGVPILGDELALTNIGHFDYCIGRNLPKTRVWWTRARDDEYRLSLKCQGDVGKCISRWEEIPDELWESRGGSGDPFYATVEMVNLNFDNTPFYHQHNRWIKHADDPSVEISALSRREIILWSDNTKYFVPFKNPHPQGYQGVYGNFIYEIEGGKSFIKVKDEFISGQHLLVPIHRIIGWWNFYR